MFTSSPQVNSFTKVFSLPVSGILYSFPLRDVGGMEKVSLFCDELDLILHWCMYSLQF